MKYIVSYAEYNRNESHGALMCGIFRETVEDIMSGWTWRDAPRSVATEHDGIECIYKVCAFADW